jgi:hypothetical protein
MKVDSTDSIGTVLDFLGWTADYWFNSSFLKISVLLLLLYNRMKLEGDAWSNQLNQSDF